MTIRWGIMGTGKIAHGFARDFAAVQNAEIQAVASRDMQKAQEFAREFGIAKAYKSYEDLVADTEIDIIYIATPHTLHYSNTLLCLNKGKAVLCEKPLAVNYQQVKEMIDLARDKNLFLMEALWTYFLPAILQAKSWIDQGQIGKITLIQANFGFKTAFDPKSRLFDPNLAGGALLDIGIYPIALAILMAEGDPVEIKASASLGQSKVDEYDAILLSFKNGIRAQLSCSLVSYLRDDAFIYGTEGYIHIPDFWHAEKAFLYQSDQMIERFEDQRNTRGFNFETDEVNRMLAHNKTESSYMPWQQSIRLIQIMDEVRRQINLTYPFE